MVNIEILVSLEITAKLIYIVIHFYNLNLFKI